MQIYEPSPAEQIEQLQAEYKKISNKFNQSKHYYTSQNRQIPQDKIDQFETYKQTYKTTLENLKLQKKENNQYKSKQYDPVYQKNYREQRKLQKVNIFPDFQEQLTK